MYLKAGPYPARMHTQTVEAFAPITPLDLVRYVDVGRFALAIPDIGTISSVFQVVFSKMDAGNAMAAGGDGNDPRVEMRGA